MGYDMNLGCAFWDFFTCDDITVKILTEHLEVIL